jgi:NAD(P)-dependent dehydrogenase (short-subunit alcohol dehydrogenase family)
MKNIIVIGGNRGVGYEIVKACLDKGYRVAITSKENQIDLSGLDQSRIFSRVFDLRDVSACKSFIDEVLSLWSKVDGVVFYAGITPISSLLDCSEKLYDDIFNINLKSSFFLVQNILPSMIRNGGGSFVFFGTSHMESGQEDRAAYAISKGGMKILSEHLARRYAKYQIRSNVIVMGWTPTEGELALRASLGVSKEQLIAEASAYVPMGRMLTVNDPVPAVMYFLSDESAMVTGSQLRVNGGEYI